MVKANGRLADGEVIMGRAFDVDHMSNYYKKLNEEWYIFGNMALFKVVDIELIIQLENELIINKSKGE